MKPGEQLVVRGGEALKDGATVRLAKGEEPSFTGEPRAAGGEGDGGTGAVR